MSRVVCIELAPQMVLMVALDATKLSLSFSYQKKWHPEEGTHISLTKNTFEVDVPLPKVGFCGIC